MWLPFLVVAAEIVITYSRLPARKLYHVSGGGLEGGLGRALVFSNFPVALVAIAVLAFLRTEQPLAGLSVRRSSARSSARRSSGPASSTRRISTRGR